MCPPATPFSSRVALGWCEALGGEDIFIGVNAVDYSGYPDCRPEFLMPIRGTGPSGNPGWRGGARALPDPRAAAADDEGADHPSRHRMQGLIFRSPTAATTPPPKGLRAARATPASCAARGSRRQGCPIRRGTAYDTPPRGSEYGPCPAGRAGKALCRDPVVARGGDGRGGSAAGQPVRQRRHAQRILPLRCDGVLQRGDGDAYRTPLRRFREIDSAGRHSRDQAAGERAGSGPAAGVRRGGADR